MSNLNLERLALRLQEFIEAGEDAIKCINEYIAQNQQKRLIIEPYRTNDRYDAQIAEFIANYCERHSTFWISVSDFYALFTASLALPSWQLPGKKLVSHALTRQGISAGRQPHQRIYKGLRLSTADELIVKEVIKAELKAADEKDTRNETPYID